MSEFEKTWQKINTIQKQKEEERVRLLQQQKEEERTHQEKQRHEEAKETRIHSNFNFLQEFVPSYLEQINKAFFSKVGDVSGWESKETKNHTYFVSWEHTLGGGRDPVVNSGFFTNIHRIQKHEVTLSTPSGKIAIFVPLKEKRQKRETNSQNIKRALSLVGWKNVRLENLYINEDCTCYDDHDGKWSHEPKCVPLDLEKDELLTELRKKILAEVIKLKTSE